jgi:cytoskeletal protein CcmA (bactofilin family)
MATAPSTLSFPMAEGERISHLGRGVRIEGKIFSNQDLQVDGEVSGTLEVSGHNLTVGAQAKVKANIKAQNISIVGTVEGSIEAVERIELCSQCRVAGEIKTRRLAIKDGAYFKGKIEVLQSKSVTAIRPTVAPSRIE